MTDRFAGEEGSDMRTSLTIMRALARMGGAREIVDAVIYLASESAPFVTGTSLKIDGGFLSQ